MTDIQVHRPGPRAWAALTVAEAKSVARDTAGLVIPLALPMLILVMNGLSVGERFTEDGVDVFGLYVMPVVLTIVIATIGVINVPSFLAYYRRSKVLRRLAVTPANPAMVLVAQVAVGIVQCAAGTAIGLAAAALLFDVGMPAEPWRALGVFALAMLTMFAVGMLVAAVAPTGNASVAIGLTLFFALGAVGGMFGPTDNLPEGLAAVGESLPFGAAVQAVGDAWIGADLNPAHLVAMLAAITVSGAVAVRFFRWD